ncbi:MAG TPA: hypothetical protein VN868_05275 [Terriglobales bacterium]|nr:hypothetical protein [Terriglobales bacterium]
MTRPRRTQYLTDPPIAGEIKWNFTKFLADRNGHVLRHFESAVTPDSAKVVSAVEKQLKQQ